MCVLSSIASCVVFVVVLAVLVPGEPPPSGMGSNRVTVTKLLQLLMILELILELGYFLNQIFIVVTVTEVTKVPKFLI